MKIALDKKHFLNSDDQCFWITVLVKPEGTRAKRDAYERRCSGYTRTFSDAVESFIEAKIRGSLTVDFTSLVKEIEELKEEVRSWKAVVERKK